MTNQELDELTNLAKSILQKLPQLLLDGRGNFHTDAGPQTQIVPASELLRQVDSAGELARELHAKLMATPRRKVNTARV